uniref:ethylbenzene dehydrogenase-related protein n=1 Tax=Yoonia sp. TaxID=2212373 RepID=UPI004048E4F4
TRTDPNDFDTVKPQSDLDTLRAAGQFIDLWQWRSSRSNPIGLGDDGFVAEERGGDAGTGPDTTNWDNATSQPKYMFNPEVAGSTALNIDAVIAGDVGFNDTYYLSAETAVPFDPTYAWQNGDTIPRRFLQPETGSRGDVVQPTVARWRNGFWDVTLQRDMDTGNPLDDKIFRDGGNYDLAFAVFRNASTMRWHYVTLPVSLGLEQPAQLVAERIEPGAEPDWTQPWTEIKTFYPGQVTWGRLTDAQQHPGAERIAARIPVAVRHSEEQLALYGVQVEFAEEIRRQWVWTLIASLSLIVGLGINVNLLMRRREDAK